jgi:hypothetical protein
MDDARAAASGHILYLNGRLKLNSIGTWEAPAHLILAGRV